MGSLILTILCIVGKVLLFLLVFILILLCLVLFVPIRYKVNGNKYSASFLVSAEGTWLCKLIRFRFAYPTPGKPELFLLFWDLFNRKPKKDKPKKEKKAKQKSSTEQSIPEENASEDAQIPAEESEEVTEENNEESIPNIEVDEPKKKKNILSSFKEIPAKWNSLKEKLLQTEDKVTAIQETIVYYYDLFNKPATARLWRQVKPSLLKALKQILPRTVHICGTFGTGDPDSTAKIYGLSSFLVINYPDQIRITPEMEEKKLEGTIQIKGHLFLFVFLMEGLKLFFNKRLRKFIKKLKAGRKK